MGNTTAKNSIGDTPFTDACYTGDLRIVQSFLNKSYDYIRETGHLGQNGFLRAASGDEIDTMRHLHSIDKTLSQAKDDRKDTALCLSVEHGSKQTVEYLISELRVDIHETGFYKRNCFLRAAQGGKIETMKYLNAIDETLSQGRDIDNDTAQCQKLKKNRQVEFPVFLHKIRWKLIETC